MENSKKLFVFLILLVFSGSLIAQEKANYSLINTWNPEKPASGKTDDTKYELSDSARLVTGAQRRDMIVPSNFSDDGRLLYSFRNVDRFPYGHLHLPDKSNNYGGMIEAMVDVLKDPGVWDPDFSAKSDLNQSANLNAATIEPLNGPVLVGKPVKFRVIGDPGNPHWELGDGATAEGSSVTHTYQEPGVYRVVMGSKVGDTFNELSSAIVRVHTPETVHLPQVFLDTDARNEVDDQHYIAYGLLSNVDVLGINSVHHGPHHINHFGAAQEPINYGEILYIIELCRISGLLAHRTENQIPRAFHGAKVPLQVPASGKWSDTQPVKCEASEAILAAARGASPDNPVWILPVGPCTNIASAILQAREEGLELKSRINICWLGGGPEQINVRSFNGGNDPWSVYVTGQSGVEFWILLENPTGKSITMDKRVDYGSLYPDNRLGAYLEGMMGQYFKKIAPRNQKPLFDVGTISVVIGNYLGKPWLTVVEPSVVLGTDQQYRWKKVDAPSNVRIIRDIDEEAMKKDFFDTLNGKPTPLPP